VASVVVNCLHTSLKAASEAATSCLTISFDIAGIVGIAEIAMAVILVVCDVDRAIAVETLYCVMSGKLGPRLWEMTLHSRDRAG